MIKILSGQKKFCSDNRGTYFYLDVLSIRDAIEYFRNTSFLPANSRRSSDISDGALSSIKISLENISSEQKDCIRDIFSKRNLLEEIGSIRGGAYFLYRKVNTDEFSPNTLYMGVCDPYTYSVIIFKECYRTFNLDVKEIGASLNRKYKNLIDKVLTTNTLTFGSEIEYLLCDSSGKIIPSFYLFSESGILIEDARKLFVSTFDRYQARNMGGDNYIDPVYLPSNNSDYWRTNSENISSSNFQARRVWAHFFKNGGDGRAIIGETRTSPNKGPRSLLKEYLFLFKNLLLTVKNFNENPEVLYKISKIQTGGGCLGEPISTHLSLNEMNNGLYASLVEAFEFTVGDLFRDVKGAPRGGGKINSGVHTSSGVPFGVRGDYRPKPYGLELRSLPSIMIPGVLKIVLELTWELFKLKQKGLIPENLKEALEFKRIRVLRKSLEKVCKDITLDDALPFIDREIALKRVTSLVDAYDTSLKPTDLLKLNDFIHDKISCNLSEYNSYRKIVIRYREKSLVVQNNKASLIRGIKELVR